MTRRRGEAGSVVLVVAGVTAVVALVALSLARVGARAIEAARARTAADAAALAGALDGEPGARALAQANGGRLVAFRVIPPSVVVTVQVGEARASARARATGSAPRSETERGPLPEGGQRLRHQEVVPYADADDPGATRDP